MTGTDSPIKQTIEHKFFTDTTATTWAVNFQPSVTNNRQWIETEWNANLASGSRSGDRETKQIPAATYLFSFRKRRVRDRSSSSIFYDARRRFYSRYGRVYNRFPLLPPFVRPRLFREARLNAGLAANTPSAPRWIRNERRTPRHDVTQPDSFTEESPPRR